MHGRPGQGTAPSSPRTPEPRGQTDRPPIRLASLQWVRITLVTVWDRPSGPSWISHKKGCSKLLIHMSNTSRQRLTPCTMARRQAFASPKPRPPDSSSCLFREIHLESFLRNKSHGFDSPQVSRFFDRSCNLATHQKACVTDKAANSPTRRNATEGLMATGRIEIPSAMLMDNEPTIDQQNLGHSPPGPRRPTPRIQLDCGVASTVGIVCISPTSTNGNVNNHEQSTRGIVAGRGSHAQTEGNA